METDGEVRRVDRASGGDVTWAEARAIALRASPSAPVEEVPLSTARGCRLAGPLTALVPVPGTDVSAMDGYAVAGEGPWRVLGRVLAGGRAHGEVLKPGCAVEIATGAPVPEGTTSVLPYEAAHPLAPAPPTHDSPTLSGEREGVWVAGVVQEGRHVRRRGEDVGLGEVVLGAGTRVTPAVLGLAAALGHDVLAVHRRLEVAVLVTGDEVIGEGLPEPGRVRDAIGPFLPGLIAWAGARVGPRLTIPDGAAPLRAALMPHPPAGVDRATSVPPGGGAPASLGDGASGSPAERTRPHPGARRPTAPKADAGRAGWDGGAEIVVVCGASSKGPADHLRAVLDDLGAEVLVDGVAVRPGHPQLLARLPCGRLVVGLPGNPFAALAAALTLLVPLLKGERYEYGERMTLAVTPTPTSPTSTTSPSHRNQQPVHAAHQAPRGHRHRNTRLVPVRRSGKGAVPVGHDRPGSLWGAAMADALAVLPPGWDGEPVELLELPD
ncbi:molybdopterin molybdotransferase MoeA [Nonomuraea dietziae]|uniref:molybdopterin molybdotransferase MoeA n=1 Tax=Nonomuraea dietziae TaxID=65515 RepID=UPI00344AC4BC